jgi:hypothetical protein
MNARKSLLSVALLASALGALTVAMPAAAVGDTTYAGWMVSRNTSAFSWYVTSPADRWNSKGTSTSDYVERLGKGSYRVNFAGYLTTGGVPMVTAIGATNWCAVPNVTFAFATSIDVSCATSNGQPADSAFSVNFLDRLTSGGPAIGYALNSAPDASGDLTGEKTYNATGGAVHTARTSKGHTTVTFFGLAHASGNVQVSTEPSVSTGTCTVSKLAVVGANEQISVICRDPLGAFADLWYHVVFVDKVSLRGAAGGAGAYFLASQPSAPSSVPPAASRWSSSGKSPVVNRLSTGRYQVTLTGIAGKGGSVQVTPVTATSNRCNIGSIPTTGTVQVVTVRCTHLNGTPADTPFSFLFTR